MISHLHFFFYLSCVRHPMTKLFPHHLVIWGTLAWSPFTVSCVMKENPLLSLIQICCEKILRCRTVFKLRMICSLIQSAVFLDFYSSYTQTSRIYFYNLILIFPWRMEFQLNNMIFLNFLSTIVYYFLIW